MNQTELAKAMRVANSSNISRTELFSKFEYCTVDFLRRYVEACGGKLTVVIEMPDKTIYR